MKTLIKFNDLSILCYKIEGEVGGYSGGGGGLKIRFITGFQLKLTNYI